MRRTDFHFDLPPDLIARRPAPRRSDSRLLHLDGRSGALVDRQFRDLPQLLRAGDLLVFNDTRVVPARLHGLKADSGGKVEMMLERVTGVRTALVQLKSSKPSRAGTVIRLGDGTQLTVTGRDDDFWRVEFDADAADVFDRLGEMPLPPYIARAAEADDRERYQTVYAREPGAVAAPTAGLHFDADAAGRVPRRRGRSSPTSPCTSVPAPSSRCAWTTWPSIACTRNVCVVPAAVCAAVQRDARAGRARRRRRHDRRARARGGGGRRRAARRSRARRGSSSRPATASAWSMRWSPTFTCRSRRC